MLKADVHGRRFEVDWSAEELSIGGEPRESAEGSRTKPRIREVGGKGRIRHVGADRDEEFEISRNDPSFNGIFYLAINLKCPPGSDQPLLPAHLSIHTHVSRGKEAAHAQICPAPEHKKENKAQDF